MMRLKNKDVGRVSDVLYFLGRSFSDVTWLKPDDMLEALAEHEKRTTVHFFPETPFRGRSRSLLDEWDYFLQVYFAIGDGKLFSCYGGSRSSGLRENHNHLIDGVLSRDLVVPTNVLVTSRRVPLAYSFHPEFSFVDHDIGTNWDSSIVDRLVGIPKSFRNDTDHSRRRVVFSDKDKETVVYEALRIDAHSRRFNDGRD